MNIFLKLGFEILLISLIAGASLIYLREMLNESLPSNEIFSHETKYPPSQAKILAHA
jgi:hypothetical protein